jgi:hypothetical protein
MKWQTRSAVVGDRAGGSGRAGSAKRNGARMAADLTNEKSQLPGPDCSRDRACLAPRIGRRGQTRPKAHRRGSHTPSGHHRDERKLPASAEPSSDLSATSAMRS